MSLKRTKIKTGRLRIGKVNRQLSTNSPTASGTKSYIGLELTGILTGIPPGTDLPPGKYVFQKTKAGLGNVPGDRKRRHQVRVWTAGTNPNTPGQQINRATFAEGVAAWHLLSPAQKETWRVPAEKLRLNNFQLWMRHWMRSP